MINALQARRVWQELEITCLDIEPRKLAIDGLKHWPQQPRLQAPNKGGPRSKQNLSR